MEETKTAEELTAQQLLDRANEYVSSPDPEKLRECQQIVEFLLTHDRNNYQLLFMLGSTYMRQNRHAMAEHLFRRVLDMAKEAGKELPEAWNNLGYTLDAEARKDEALACFHHAISLKSDEAAFVNNVATSYVNNGTPEQAIEWCDKALALDPEMHDAKWNKGLAHLELGHWHEGWEGYRHGLFMEGSSSGKRKTRDYHDDGTPYWEGSAGKSVVVYGEQGVGDEILATSMLEEAADRANIIYEAHPRLVNIMRHTFGHRLPIYGTRKQDQIPWPLWHEIDAKCPIFDLGRLLRQRDEDFPRVAYLKPFEEQVAHYREQLAQLGPKPKIGVSWKGGSLVTRHDLRSLPLASWLPIFGAIDADWISLQYDPADRPGLNAPIVEAFVSEHGVELHHWPDIINDLDQCYGGLMHALDLVISVNGSVVHACGAYGLPCWVLTPSRPAWRYGLSGDRMPWYGDWVKQYRQQGDDWTPAIETLVTDLRSWYEEVTAA